MKVDGKIIKPTTHYTFSSNGNKQVVYYLKNGFTTMQNMFRNCIALKTIDFKNCDTSKVTNMRALFHTCIALQNILFNNKWKTNKVTDFGYMFYDCRVITSAVLEPFLCIFNTLVGVNFDSMFNSCSNIQSLRFDKFTTFRTPNAINMKYMFSNMKSLISYDYSGKYGTDNFGYKGLKINTDSGINILDTSKVQNMEGIFSGCSNSDFTYINLKWQYNNLRYCKWMFAGCSNLYTITMTGNIYDGLLAENCEQMFYECPQWGVFYYNGNEDKYSSLIIPQLTVLNWTCTSQ